MCPSILVGLLLVSVSVGANLKQTPNTILQAPDARHEIPELDTCSHDTNFPTETFTGNFSHGNPDIRSDKKNKAAWLVRLEFRKANGISACGGTVISQDLIITGKLL